MKSYLYMSVSFNPYFNTNYHIELFFSDFSYSDLVCH